jgi:AcrR family transcriptional regulator
MAATSEKRPMKERILETADRLFYRQGIRAVGVDTIAAEIGISKRTLYNHFPSKDDLIAAYLTRRSKLPSKSERPALDQILGAFDRLDRSFGSDEFRGCPFVNAVAELGEDVNPVVKEIARTFKEGRRAWFVGLLKELKLRNANALATQLAILVDGAIAADLVRQDKSAARAAKRAAIVLLRDAGLEVGGEAN